MSLGRLLFAACLLCELLLAGLAFVAHEQAAALREAGHRRQEALRAGQVVRQFHAHLQGLIAAVEGLARADTPAEGGEAMAASAMPGARAIRFLPPPATTPPDVAGAPPLGYAGLLLVREAGEGGRPPLQIHRFGEPDQVIALARPIEREGAVTGVLYATFDPLLLEGWLKGAVPEEGYAELHQNGEGEPLRLAAIGNAGLKGGEPPVVTAVIPGTAWRLACWLPGAPPPAPEEEMLFFAPFAVAAAAIALLFALLALLFGRLLHGDLVTLVRRMGGSNREERGEVRLAEFQEAVQVLEAHRPPAPPFEAPPAPRIRTMADLSSSMNGAGARNEPPVAAKEAGGATKG